MRLVSLSYSELAGQPQEWSLHGLTLGARTLVVGRNATGKTRTLTVINCLCLHLLGQRGPALAGNFEAVFDDEGRKAIYTVRYNNAEIFEESFSVDGRKLLTRGAGGFGEIFSEKDQTNTAFQSPVSVFAAVMRRDSLHHSFLEPLHQWALTSRLFQFGSHLGKESIAFFVDGAPKVDERDQNQVIGLFRDGFRNYGQAFVDAILADMAQVGYAINNIWLAPPVSIHVNVSIQPGGPSMAPSVLLVQEADLPGVTDQFGMSQGMYRVTALLIHLNYLAFKKASSCILIDDIGEGLDFERSCKLISLLRDKSIGSNVQIILATNDRFVMNEVPLEEWAILIRNGNQVRVKNAQNSPKEFEDLRFTGLSNFSLLEMGLLDGPIEEAG